jgi:glycosyltransferase involved in cell wall biosynthesis
VVARAEGGPCRCLFVGEVNHAIKGSDVLLQAFQRVHEVEPTALLEIVGDGPDRDQDETFVRRHNLDDVVRFTGAIPADRVLQTIDKADIVVMASRTEGMPRIILEAFARGVPVVAPRVGGIPEVVKEGATGVLVDPDDPAALAEGLLGLITDPAQRRRLGAHARAWVDELPMWAGVAEQIETIYASAVPTD